MLLNDFFCTDFALLTASIELTYFQICKNTLFESLPDSLAVTREEPSKEIDEKFLRMQGHFGVAMT